MNTFTPVYIISAERAELNAGENGSRTEALRRDLLAIDGVASVADVQGCYKGETERAFIVPAHDPESVRLLAAKYGQESILHLDANRHASLEFVEHSAVPFRIPRVLDVEPLGQWRPVRNGENPDAYTVADGRAYTAG